MNQVFINKEPVELYKILKFEGLRASGAEAKAAIADGEVKLNVEFETQKRKPFVAGDVIRVDGGTYSGHLEGQIIVNRGELISPWFCPNSVNLRI